jgi:prophage regulatory protein
VRLSPEAQQINLAQGAAQWRGRVVFGGNREMKFLSYEDLKSVGVPFSRVHLDRLQRQGRFPKKIHFGGNTVVYSADEIAAWIEARVAERDSKSEAA